ncbi:DUF1660 family phage protein [Croceiramulus getboli]|nr:DUF1660 family phage protein [Flavobacteriaceae bacterium YJPT1-3]
MKTTTTPKSTPHTSFLCKLFGHKYKITKRYASSHKEFECSQCKAQYTLDDYGRYTPLTSKLQRINEVMEKFYLARHARIEHRQAS